MIRGPLRLRHVAGTDTAPRLTLPAAPPTTLVARPAFAVLPWIVLSACLLAAGVSEWLRHPGPVHDWLAIGGATGAALLSAVLAGAQYLVVARSPRTSLWLYAAGTTLVMVAIAAFAVRTDGLLTPYYAGVLPIATYLAIIVPRRGRSWLLAGLFAFTATVQVVQPTASLFDAAVVWTLVVAGWACGVLSSLEHARLTKITRRLEDYDRTSRALNRRAFLAKVDRALADPDRSHAPIAVLLVDLVAFGSINALRGDAEGDALLCRVGETFAAVLPENAELGRLGDDRFGVLLPGAPRSEAEAVGHRIRSFLHDEIDASVGVAASQVRALTTDDLVRVAEAALAVAKRDGLGIHVLVAGSTSDVPVLRPVPSGRPPVHYVQIRSTGHVPRAVDNLTLYSWISTISSAVLALCGAVVIATAWLDGDGGNSWDDLVRYGGPAWLVWVGALTALTRVPSFTRPGPRGWFVLANSTAAVTTGVCVAALADGGLVAPITGALFVKVLFDAATLPWIAARLNVVLLLAGWALFAVLSPAGTQWLVPFQLVMLGGCFALGAMSQHARVDAIDYARSLAEKDDLTGLPNRVGFRQRAEAAYLDAVTRTGAPFALIWVALEDPARRPGATLTERDRMIELTTNSIIGAIPDAYVVGRTGELEVMVAAPRFGRAEAFAAARAITEAAAPLAVARAGVGACPEDGATPELLARAAQGLPPLTVRDAGLPTAPPTTGVLPPLRRVSGG